MGRFWVDQGRSRQRVARALSSVSVLHVLSDAVEDAENAESRDPVGPAAAIATLGEHSELPQALQMLANLCQREPDGLRKLRRRCFAIADQVEDLESHGMRNRPQDRGNRFEDTDGQQWRR